MTSGKGGEVDLLLTIISDPRIGWRTVAICGRAIAAIGRLNYWLIETGKKALDGDALSGLILTFGDASERISDVWNSFLETWNEEILQAELSSLVETMETAVPDPQI